MGAGLTGGEKIGTGAHRRGGITGTCLDDGNVHQRRKGAVWRGQGDGDNAVADHRDRGDLGQALGIAVRLPGPVQGGLHVRGGQRRAVGKGDASPEGELIAVSGCVVGIAAAQTELRLQLGSQAEQPLIHQ